MGCGLQLFQHVAVLFQRFSTGFQRRGRIANLPEGIVLIERDNQSAQNLLRKGRFKTGGSCAPGGFTAHVERHRAQTPAGSLVGEYPEHLFRDRGIRHRSDRGQHVVKHLRRQSLLFSGELRDARHFVVLVRGALFGLLVKVLQFRQF